MLAYKLMTYHTPVMLDECMEGLAINPDGIYVDLTFGGGGHSRRILDSLSDAGHLYAFDQDKDAQDNLGEFEGQKNFTFVPSNFRYFDKYLKMYKVEKVDGILADLGVSSYQIDEPTRGFSTRFDGELDMRMDQAGSVTAKSIIQTYSLEKLQDVFSKYGEVRNAKTLADRIVREREGEELNTIEQFKEAIKGLAPRGKENKYLAQVFQALRIEVNEEMKALEDMLLATERTIKTNGRLVIMSYHSLEDRPVKYWMNSGNFAGKLEKDFYGNIIRPFDPVTRKPITASSQELNQNPRARSAKLRIAKRNG